jgi:hypothetical protein
MQRTATPTSREMQRYISQERIYVMSKKRILTIGLELASSETEHVGFHSKTSLLDCDIVLFKPKIGDFFGYSNYFQGKPSLENCEHWRREIKQAVEAGKTVIVYLSELKEVFVDTGQRSYSGTGRNQRTTRHVTEYSNYHAIPAVLSPIIATGNTMKLSGRCVEVLASYWSEFEAVSQYKVQLTEPKVPSCIVTRSGDIPVGALYRSTSSVGTLLLLPDIDFYSNKFIKELKGKERWTLAAKHFATRMLMAIVVLDKALRSTGEVTPEPQWATEPEFILSTESAIRVQLLEAGRTVEIAQGHKENLEDQLKSAGSFRALLFEKGKPLENAIIGALRILGFIAAPFKNSDSEFDVVFESEEGRLIGEAEGKDNKAINIDKLRQLAMNIHEDLQRENVIKPAKPVLFGNGYRLLKLSERGNPFTEKCISAAATTSTALVFTPDLFPPVQYLVVNADPEYARACRQAMFLTTCRVSFPPTPKMDELSDQIQAEQVK